MKSYRFLSRPAPHHGCPMHPGLVKKAGAIPCRRTPLEDRETGDMRQLTARGGQLSCDPRPAWRPHRVPGRPASVRIAADGTMGPTVRFW